MEAAKKPSVERGRIGKATWLPSRLPSAGPARLAPGLRVPPRPSSSSHAPHGSRVFFRLPAVPDFQTDGSTRPRVAVRARALLPPSCSPCARKAFAAFFAQSSP